MVLLHLPIERPFRDWNHGNASFYRAEPLR